MDWYNLRNDPFYAEFFDYVSKNHREGNPSVDYELISVKDNLLISPCEVKRHLKLDDDDLEDDGYYELIIQAAIMVAEFIMRKELIEKRYYAYFDSLPSSIKILKRPVRTINSIQYLDTDNATWVTIDPTIYYTLSTKTYPTIFLDSQKSWPTTPNTRFNSIRIDFTTGVEPDFAGNLELPYDVKLAALHHIAVLHEQRGDWGSADIAHSQFIQCLPTVSKIIYSRYRVTNRGNF